MLQKLTKTQINILTAILILINLGIVIFWISFWLSLKKPVPPPIIEKPAPAEEIPEPLKPGETGETEETLKGEKRVVIPGPPGVPEIVLPLVIFNGTGRIKEIGENSLVIAGDGSTFADLKPRDLTLKITEDTVISEKGQKVWYKGLEGLKHLKAGEEITFQATENIRGKTEFFVDSITKI